MKIVAKIMNQTKAANPIKHPKPSKYVAHSRGIAKLATHHCRKKFKPELCHGADVVKPPNNTRITTR
jgi:hypothetical protein